MRPRAKTLALLYIDMSPHLNWNYMGPIAMKGEFLPDGGFDEFRA